LSAANKAPRRATSTLGNGKKSGGERFQRLHRAREWIESDIWQRDLVGLPTFRRIGLHSLRVAFLLWRGLNEHQSFFRAAALTYITVLSLVPLLAFGFALAKGFGAYDYLLEEVVNPFLDGTFGALPADQVQAGDEGGVANALVGSQSESPGPVRPDAEEALAANREAAEDDERDVTAPLGADVTAPLGANGAAPLGADVTAPLGADVTAPLGANGAAPLGANGAAPLGANGAAVEGPGLRSDRGGEREAVVPVDDDKNQLREAFNQLFLFVSGTNVANLGIVGLIVLVFTVLKLMAHIEGSFNAIWGVVRPRTLVRKFADYLSIVAITPLLLIAASALRAALSREGTTAFMREELMLGPVVELGLRTVPFIGLWLGFTVLGLVMPNTRVHLRSAIVGGFFGAAVWSLIQVGYVNLQWGVSQYNALYAGFAAIPLFLVWVWLSWIAVLLAAEISYADQHSDVYMRQARGGPLEPGQRRVLALALAVQVAEQFLAGDPPVELETWLERFVLPEKELVDVFCTLEGQGILARLDRDDGHAWVLARDPSHLRATDVLTAIDGKRDHGFLGGDSRAETTLISLEEARDADPANRTLRELANLERHRTEPTR